MNRNVIDKPGTSPAGVTGDEIARPGEASPERLFEFEELYRIHGERMKSIAWNHLGSRSDAEDAVQETFMKMHRSMTTFRRDAQVSTWLYRILLNTCYDMLRRRRVRPDETELEAAGEFPGPRNADDVLRMTLRTLLGQLDARKREVFILAEVEGLSHSEVAAIMGITVSYSKWLLFTTKKELRAMWKVGH
ncbi:MAG: RNA polymerase sigma factor [Acidobacteriota bacterium]